MKTTIALILSAAALALSGCVFTPTGAIAKYIPEGTYKNLNFQVGTNYGSVVIAADGVVKTDTTLTATDLTVTVASPVQPLMSFSSTGYAPPGPAPAPTSLTAAPSGPPEPNVVIHLK